MVMTVEFRTTIFESRDGTETRAADRSNPRIVYAYQGSAHSSKAQEVKASAQIIADRPLVFGSPAYKGKISVALPDAGNVFSMASIPAWLVIGSFIVLKRKSRSVLALVANITGTAVTIDEPLDEGFPVGTYVLNGFQFRQLGPFAMNYLTNSKFTAKSSLAGLVGVNYVPDSGVEGDTYLGKEVLVKKPNWADLITNRFTPRVDVVDFQFGRRAFDTYLDFIPEDIQATYVGIDTDSALDFLAFFMRQKGRRGDFYLPSWINDLPLAELPVVAPLEWPTPTLTDIAERPGTVPSHGTHRYWRINCHHKDGDSAVIIQNIEFRDTVGGVDLTGSGTAISGDNWTFGGDPAKAFDADPNSSWPSAKTGINKWIGYDFGPGNDIDLLEIAVTNATVDDLGSPFINQGAHYLNGPDRYFVEYSDNGHTWTRHWGVAVDKNTAPFNGLATPPEWAFGDNIRVFTKDTFDATGPRRFWRLYVTETQDTSKESINITEIEYRIVKGGADTTVPGGGDVTASDVSGTGPEAFDDVFASGTFVNNTWDSTNPTPKPYWIVYDYGEGNEIEMIESLIAFPDVSARAGWLTAPSRFVFQYSDDGVEWFEAWNVGQKRGEMTLIGERYELLNGNSSYKNIYIMTKAGDLEYNSILSAEVVDGNTVLTLDGHFSNALSPDDVLYVGWLNSARFASDELNIEWLNDSVAQFQVPFTTIKDVGDI
jgi:hypothetical protein